MAAFETRTRTAEFQMRDDTATGAPILEGYAATFSQEYDLGPFREVIDPSAFSRTLSNGPDVRLLVDHDGQPLARTKSGTLSLTPDGMGLAVRATLDPSDPDVQRLLPKMRRGDLDQMSFAFRVPEGGDSWNDSLTLRTLREVNLSGGDVSVVTYPANPGTMATVRSEDLREAEYVFAIRCFREVRVGNALSPESLDKLQSILQGLTAADDDPDAAGLAAVLTTPTPDVEPAQANSRPLELSRRIAAALSL